MQIRFVSSDRPPAEGGALALLLFEGEEPQLAPTAAFDGASRAAPWGGCARRAG